MMLLVLLLCGTFASAQCDSMLVMFWNLENFFDPSDPQAPPGWTSKRFCSKCNAVAKTVFEIADTQGRLPDAIGFAEIGNRAVLQRLVSSTLLGKLDYRIVHYDSPDRRGIDCSLLYRASRLNLERSFPVHLTDSAGTVLQTRDILVCIFDKLTVLVNHHPSKLGEGAGQKRSLAMATMTALADSLAAEGHKVLAMGDFNDTLWGTDVPGTIKFNGRWEKIDGGFGFGDISFSEKVFYKASLMERDNSHGGYKSRRTFVGSAYNGGVSDHFPVLFTIFAGISYTID